MMTPFEKRIYDTFAYCLRKIVQYDLNKILKNFERSDPNNLSLTLRLSLIKLET